MTDLSIFDTDQEASLSETNPAASASDPVEADLLGNRSDEAYTYRAVAFADLSKGRGAETGTLGNVTGGTVELSYLSDLKAVCSFDYEGGESLDPNELVRIYYSFEDDDGNAYSDCVGTFLVGYDEVSYEGVYSYSEASGGIEFAGLKVSGSANGWSVLKILHDRVLGYPYTVQADANPVSTAVSIMQGFGLAVESSTGYGGTLSSCHTFDSSDTMLAVVNWLCTTAGCRAPYPDAFGIVHVDLAEASTRRAPVAVFENDDRSIMYPEVIVGNDWQSTPNVARLSYETDEQTLWASATNKSGTRASLNARGRELTVFESVTELSGGLAELKEMAVTKLRDNSQEIEHVSLSHPYIGLRPNDPVRIKYGETVWAGNVLNVSIDLSSGTKCDTEIRRYVPSEMVITTDGGAL